MAVTYMVIFSHRLNYLVKETLLCPLGQHFWFEQIGIKSGLAGNEDYLVCAQKRDNGWIIYMYDSFLAFGMAHSLTFMLFWSHFFQ